ncbi:hypothetical protein DEO72_LG8g1505 [Vigna unguiculata]|uniref:Uncharacterized protein n=1 Tax=Vigna unguiculata TaxID=3917 RepID=A0A4D6MS62_VIGUN|nr:hypothetical protein DEO72_LG8g1505 [Vigna unguiculata]
MPSLLSKRLSRGWLEGRQLLGGSLEAAYFGRFSLVIYAATGFAGGRVLGRVFGMVCATTGTIVDDVKTHRVPAFLQFSFADYGRVSYGYTNLPILRNRSDVETYRMAVVSAWCGWAAMFCCFGEVGVKWCIFRSGLGLGLYCFTWDLKGCVWELMAKEALDVASRRVVDALERLPPRAPRKWIVCCYLTDDPGRDVCGVMDHYAKKVGASEDLFAKIRDQLAASSKGEGSSEAPILAGPVVKTDRKRLRALAKTGGVAPGGSNNPNLGDFENAKFQMRKGVEIKLTDPEVAIVEAVDPGLIMRALNEYMSLSTMMQEEIAAGDKKKLADELATLKALKLKQVEVDELQAKRSAEAEEAADEISGLQQAVYSEHVKGFKKALRQAKFLYKEVSITDCRFNVNLDIYDNKMMDVVEISRLKVLAKEGEAAHGEEEALVTSPVNVGGDNVSNKEVAEEEVEAADGENDVA